MSQESLCLWECPEKAHKRIGFDYHLICKHYNVVLRLDYDGNSFRCESCFKEGIPTPISSDLKES